jgi:asparagine synthase (glutamine-hydrolysing)
VTPYFEYRSTDHIAESMNDSHLMAGLEHAVDSAVSRLTSYANGRAIVIPLSGGRDSRLVALKLRQIGYPEVVCFSYGSRSGIEARVSSHVAGQLGFDWKFVPYGNGMWNRCRDDPAFVSFRQQAHGLSAVEHVQDWPALKVLRNQIPEDAVLVPGHSHDFLAGSHLPQAWERRSIGGWAALEKAMVHKHFSLWPREMLARVFGEQRAPELWAAILARTQASMQGFNMDRVEGLVQAFEFWDWRERQAKFVVNSMRTYDFYGFNWWLPWFDDEIAKFWASTQLSERFEKRLLNRYVDSFQETLGVGSLPFDKNGAVWNSLRAVHLLEPALKVWHRIRSHDRGAYMRLHPMSWYSLVEPEISRWGYSGVETINSYLSIRHVGDFSS